jgi:hypothetical protein
VETPAGDLLDPVVGRGLNNDETSPEYSQEHGAALVLATSKLASVSNSQTMSPLSKPSYLNPAKAFG